jgi:hypothetical protein
MGWERESNGRVPTWQMQGIESKPQYHQKKKKNDANLIKICSVLFFTTLYSFKY